MEITAAVIESPGEPFAIRSLALAEPRDDEILVRIEAVGICHTDIYFSKLAGYPFPAVLGHEGAGIVERVGKSISKVVPGDKVILTFRSCGSCSKCASHKPAYCRELASLNFVGRRLDGSTGLRHHHFEVSGNFFGQSSFATHALAYERNVVKIPSELRCRTYAPLGCGIQTGAGAVLRSLDCDAGSSLVVVGGGTVGLSAVMAAAIRQCRAIVLVEPHEARRALAIELGATHVIDPSSLEPAEQIQAILPHGADFVLDTTGSPKVIGDALAYLGFHATFGLVAAPSTPDATLTALVGEVVTKGITIKGIIEGDSDPDQLLPELIGYHLDGKFPFHRLIAEYDLEDINRAIDDQHAGLCVKPVLITRP